MYSTSCIHKNHNQNHHHHHHMAQQGMTSASTASTSSFSLATAFTLTTLSLPRHLLYHAAALVLIHAVVFQFQPHTHNQPSSLSLFPIAQAKSVVSTATAKSSSCTYTVVINEFDSSKCSSMNPYIQADGVGLEKETSEKHKAGMMKDRSATWYGNYGNNKQSSTSSNVETQLKNVENTLLEEMVRSREINSTLNRQASMLITAQKTLENYKANFTHVFRAMVHMERRLHHQRRINRSLNKKLSNVILDVVEVNNVLTRKTPRGSAKKSAAKSFQVESVCKVMSCAGIAESKKIYQDCADVYDSGHHRSDVYYIKPLYAACPIPVWCDMDSPKAGWLLIQRRQDGSVSFNRKWEAYRDGFGDVIGEHWLGNDNIFLLTNQKKYQLRIDLWDFSGNRVHALYSNFKIEGERDRYRLHVSGFSGSAKDALMRHNNKHFSTEDHDHDNRRDASCATEWEAGWWFDKCWYALLNGPYANQSDVRYKGIAWKSWKFEQLRGAEMKIRPVRHSRR